MKGTRSGPDCKHIKISAEFILNPVCLQACVFIEVCFVLKHFITHWLIFLLDILNGWKIILLVLYHAWM